jgi:SNF2 family DNA or RNA helicase
MMPRGGILADEMGLGKTITTIAIACANPAVVEKVEKVEKSESVFLPPASSGPQSANALVKSRATLVICPLSVLTTWRDEINRAVVDEIRKVRIFYGPCRISDPVDLANSDFVITTYSVIVSEAKTHMAAQQAAEEAKKQEGTTSNTPAAAVKRLKGESALYAINWHRVVLDEAHTVRCKKTLARRLPPFVLLELLIFGDFVLLFVGLYACSCQPHCKFPCLRSGQFAERECRVQVGGAVTLVPHRHSHSQHTR